MKPGRLTKQALAVAALLSPSAVLAETYSETYNGATCIPYPPFNSANAVPYRSWLYGFRESAFCHFNVPNTWSINNLSFVLFTGTVSSGLMRVRLCVATGLSYSCGAERTLSSSGTVEWVVPPSPVPAYATGVYLSVSFPPGAVSTFQHFYPYWSR